jgi:glycosyltransferase involved in cell wall biosynthesis
MNRDWAEPWLKQKSTEQNPPGRILFQAGAGVFQRPGGGEIQLIKTGAALEARGVPVGLYNAWADRLEEARLVHFFGLHAEFEPLARLAKKAGIGVVVSPICWYDPVAQWYQAERWTAGLVGLSKWLLLRHSGLARRRAWRSRLLAMADAVLPNSLSEADQMATLLGVPRQRLHVVPNAVDAATAPPDLALAEFGPEDYVLYVGRIEPRKNVLGLIQACLQLKYKLVIIGQAPLEHAAYDHACRKLAETGQVYFAGHVPKDAPLLASAQASARVFALPSWFETPGLAALEAAQFETPVVITRRGSTRDYFGDTAIYCDPARPASVQAAIERAWHTPPQGRAGLAQRIKSDWTWPEVARIMEGIYDAVAA